MRSTDPPWTITSVSARIAATADERNVSSALDRSPVLTRAPLESGSPTRAPAHVGSEGACRRTLPRASVTVASTPRSCGIGSWSTCPACRRCGSGPSSGLCAWMRSYARGLPYTRSAIVAHVSPSTTV
jgi:hypothetical protein